MATLTLSSTTSHSEALTLAGALLDWVNIQDDDLTFRPVKVHCTHNPDGTMTISTVPRLELVK